MTEVRKGSPMKTCGRIFQDFRDDASLVRELGVTKEEMNFLYTVSLFGSVASSRDFVFILKNIRAAKSTAPKAQTL